MKKVALLTLAMMLVTPSAMAKDLPTCDSEDAKSIIGNLLLRINSMAKVLGTKNIKDISGKLDVSKKRICGGIVYVNLGAFKLKYSFEWVDEDQGIFNLHINEADPV